jgi:hypothetical protein
MVKRVTKGVPLPHAAQTTPAGCCDLWSGGNLVGQHSVSLPAINLGDTSFLDAIAYPGGVFEGSGTQSMTIEHCAAKATSDVVIEPDHRIVSAVIFALKSPACLTLENAECVAPG